MDNKPNSNVCKYKNTRGSIVHTKVVGVLVEFLLQWTPLYAERPWIGVLYLHYSGTTICSNTSIYI